jgi:acyl-CoA synthetase (AMP-forming)/AMP-acid ligase II
MPDTLIEPPPILRVHEIVAQWAARQPAAIALSDASTERSYAELEARIVATSAWLGALGLQRGQRVMVIGENSVALATLLLGINRAGLVAVMENARRAPGETDLVLSYCQPSAVFCVLDHSTGAAAHAERLGASIVEDAPAGRIAVRMEPAAQHAPADADAEEMRDVAAIIYTTGTTGKPKGVMIPFRAFGFIADQMRSLRFVTPDDRIYGVLPITHAMGLASVLYGGLISGAHVHLVPRFQSAECAKKIIEDRFTMIQGAPAMFAKIVDHCRTHGVERIENMRFTASGGAPIDPTIKRECEALFGVPLHNGYGLTEAPSCCWTRFEDDNADDTVGRALPDVEIRLEAPNSEGIGELWVRGPHVMAGYFQDPERTAQVLTHDRWFNTQDLARVGNDGRVHIVGRTRDLIIRSGFNVYPLEIEHALSMHPDVVHCAVLGRPVKGNEEIVAFVELTRNAQATPNDLLGWLTERLSPYKRPSQIVVMDDMPVAANGKVLKTELTVPAI